MNIVFFDAPNNKVRSNSVIQMTATVVDTNTSLFLVASDPRVKVDRLLEFISPDVSLTFDVEIGTFATGETFSVSAYYAGEQATCKFEIVANGIASIELSPTSLTNGGTADLTITLDAPSNVGGTYVRLRQLREDAYKIPLIIDLPVSLLIPAASSSQTITVTAATTSLVLRDTIVASLNGIEVTKEIRLNG